MDCARTVAELANATVMRVVAARVMLDHD